MDEQLIPCPFCGSPDTCICGGRLHAPYWGHCNGCGAEGPFHHDRAEAVRLWNTRAERITLLGRFYRLTLRVRELESRFKQVVRNEAFAAVDEKYQAAQAELAEVAEKLKGIDHE